jgi:hypothetical protein
MTARLKTVAAVEGADGTEKPRVRLLLSPQSSKAPVSGPEDVEARELLVGHAESFLKEPLK